MVKELQLLTPSKLNEWNYFDNFIKIAMIFVVIEWKWNTMKKNIKSHIICMLICYYYFYVQPINCVWLMVDYTTAVLMQ